MVKWSALARALAAGALVAALVALGGRVLERAWFGATDADALARVEAEIQQRFDDSADRLRELATRAAADHELIGAAAREVGAAIRLFDALDAALAGSEAGTGVTVYDPGGTPIAWAGRVADPPRALDAGEPLVLAVSALGPRLTWIEPVVSPPATRLATVVAEQILEPIDQSPALGEELVLNASLAPVTLRVGARTPTSPPATFSIAAPTGGTLVDAEVAPGDLAGARARWRHRTLAAVLAVLAITLLWCAGLFVEARRQTRTPWANLAAAAAVGTATVLARLVLEAAIRRAEAPPEVAAPLGLFLTALTAAALVYLVIDLIEARRLAPPRAALVRPGSAGVVGALYLAAGAVAALCLWGYARMLDGVVSGTTVDLLHLSVHPFDAARLMLVFGLVVLHAAIIWLAAAVLRLPTLAWRTPRGGLRAVARAAAAAGALAAVLFAAARDPSTPGPPLLFAVAVAAACALSLPAFRVRSRRMSQSTRLAALFLALLAPAMGLYPLLSAFAVQAKERLIAEDYGAEVLTQREQLQAQLVRALEQIDALAELPQLVASAPDEESASLAFAVWTQTELQRFRLTSAVELYGPDGQRVSRFALILPDAGAARYRPTGCDWDLSDDVQPAIRVTRSPVGASESHVLRASRGICAGGRPTGGIIVRTMLDYRTLPFIAPRSPYVESLRPDRPAPDEGVSGRDVEFVLYGWSRAPLFASNTSVWTLPDEAFDRMVRSREPFWMGVARAGEQFRVYFMSDRGGIYALGYPVVTAFGHLINLAEIVFLALLLLVLLIAGATLFNVFFSRAPTSGPALIGEIRASYYRKLRLAFVAGSVVPVIILAVTTRAYLANELTAGLEDAAARTATVAQRLVEDYATLQQRGPRGLETVNDDIMVLVSRAIDEDVNLFDRARLHATSALDLYASQLLSTRTPADVYRRLLLERAPTHVGEQEVGGIRYLVAAAPVRTGGREGIVTVPVTLRPQEIGHQIDELDRRVLFAAVLFSLLGGAVGYWMAERIADPVNRLTRATRRIARGDLDARIAATSADELGRLVRDFNQMAADLRRQRTELERTQRLEAWAEMARQVAHDIKNPLTPIQLSAEHARRVNIDHGRPLSPALDECVTAILGQVRLLRQIASEFSSFASSPTAHPEPTPLAGLLEEVVAPYRAGLADRIDIDVQAPGDLPPLFIDRNLFARALSNIIENALYAMPGRGRLAITAAGSTGADAAGSGGRVAITVADTGVGMDEEAVAKIFEPYFSTKATGTGLGLTIAKRNIELNGGAIRVASQRGVGTTVTLTLPVLPDPAARA